MPEMYDLDHPDKIEVERWELELDRREIAPHKREAELDLIHQKLEQLSKPRMRSERWLDTPFRPMPTVSCNGQLDC